MPAPSAPTAFAVASRANPGRGLRGGSSGTLPALRLSWTWNGGDAAQMEMRLAGVGDFIPFPAAPTAGLFITAVINGTVDALVWGLRWNIGYDFRIRAINGSGVSAWATLNAVATGAAAASGDLIAPTTLAVASNTNRGVVFTWNDNQDKESGYQIEIVGIGGEIFRTEIDPFGFTFTAVPQPARTPDFSRHYTARVRAFLAQDVGPSRVYGPWSNEMFFATAAQAIALTNVPQTVIAWRNVAFSFTAFTNIAASSWVIGALPPGLTATAGVISGTPTANVGNYNVSVAATNGNTDTQTLTIEVRQPSLSLLFAADGSNEFLPASEAADRGVTTGSIGAALTIQVGAAAIGPISTTITPSLSDAPAWLSISGTTITGTPPSSGTFEFTVSGTNGVQTATALLRVIVPTVRIVSTDVVEVFAGQPFTFTLTSAPGGAVFSSTNLPAWALITSANAGAQTLRGTAPTAGDTRLDLLATFGGETAAQAVTIRSVAIFDLETEWNMTLDQPTYQTAHYVGAGTVAAWYLVGAPPGLTITPLYDNRRASVEGTPTANGFFDAVVIVRVTIGDDVHLFSTPISIVVAGGLFVPWLHSDPHLFDLQVQVRGDASKRVVQSYYATARQIHPARNVTTTTGDTKVVQDEPVATESFVFTLKRGDTAKLAILLRDGADILTTGISNVQLVFREPQADRDDQYMLSGTAVLVDLGGGHLYFGLTLQITSDIIDAIFDRDARAQIETFAELSWVWSGDTFTALSFPISILRDENR